MVWGRPLLYVELFLLEKKNIIKEVLIYDPLSDNSYRLCQIRKPFLSGAVQSGWQRGWMGWVIDAEAHHCHPSSPRREEKSCWFGAVGQVTAEELLVFFAVLGEVSPQTNPACCLPTLVPPGALQTHFCLQGHGKGKNEKALLGYPGILGWHCLIHAVHQAQRAE